jgi:hypothetical protein
MDTAPGVGRAAGPAQPRGGGAAETGLLAGDAVDPNEPEPEPEPEPYLTPTLTLTLTLTLTPTLTR